MSIATILAFVLTGVAAKTKSVQVAKPSEDKRVDLIFENADLRARVADCDREIAELRDALAAANARARRDQELIDLWRERALASVPPLPSPQFALQQQYAALQQQAAAQMQAQCNQQAAQNAQNFYAGVQYQNQLQGHAQGLGQAIGQLGAQMIDAELWCNCVPARHDMLMRGR